MITEKVRDYIAECPYLDEFTALNVDYLIDKVKAYTITEQASYNPIVSEWITGHQECVYRFNLDCRFYWTDEVENNINNSNFFENFSEWIKNKDKLKEYPQIDYRVTKMEVLTNGYLFDSDSNQAIYRIGVAMYYERPPISGEERSV